MDTKFLHVNKEESDQTARMQADLCLPLAHRNGGLMIYATSTCRDQLSDPRSLIKVCTVFRYILQYPPILQAGNESPDQTAHLRSLILAFAARK